MPTIAMIGQKGLPARSGGIERHVQHLATSLVERGHRVIVFGRAWYVAQSKAPNGVEQIITKGIKTKHLDAITHSFTAILAARKLRPDIVHIHGAGIAVLVPLVRLLVPKAKVVVTFHCIDRVLTKWGRFARLVFSIGEWSSCHLAHRTVTVSQDLAQYCAKTYGVQPWYIPHGIPQAEFPAKAQEYLEKHELTEDQYFLFVGRLIPDKEAHLLIEAYALAAQKSQAVKKIPLVLVGASSFSDSYAKSLIHRAAAISGVHYLGERYGEEMAVLQSRAMAHVFPSSSEGLSLAIVEACQYGKTVIATDIPANREATGGWMIPVGLKDIEGMSEALVRIAERHPAERRELGQRAQVHVARVHDCDERANDMVRVYADVLGQSRDLVTPIQLSSNPLASL
ncbi:MAG TPA: glycosyltransferase family 4 protein [bacterium]|nr:glycosyltransferase family 4 protein [Candidatus Magasanikbacteria bacterium]MCA9389418.1 glycosyltransferase family 4 protein [Candidatus Magasanikbacteria bacterium]USN52683.1 MAG: glycosyltransferase family 4 protein [Candidatus Nomurabacteria bacterium]HPF95410.1 glycosyltransferase family 4 protein [bacterium]